MTALVRGHRAAEVAAGLDANPSLNAWRDPRGRNWLHACCMAKASDPDASIETARVLLDRGFGIDEPAFAEGDWRATPLWHAIAHGRNLKLARFLLESGADPNYCLWAAAFEDDAEAIRLLHSFGADLEDVSAGDTPFLWAVQWSRFEAARALLELGAKPDAVDGKGRTALHLMLKKGSDKAHLAMVAAFGARGDIADAGGVTAIDLLARKRDPELRALGVALQERSGAISSREGK